MLNLLTKYFYFIDFALAILIVVIIIILYFTKRIDKLTWFLYWIGSSLGMIWEFSMVFLTEMDIFAFYIYHSPPPTHFMIIVFTHSLWDGGIFLVGYRLVKIIIKEGF